MKVSIGQLRTVIREEYARTEVVNELFGKKDFASALDAVLQGLADTNKKVEHAHELAPQGPAKAIVAGLHSDLFNQIGEFRKYVEKLKSLTGHQP
jgi:hypothetical protein